MSAVLPRRGKHRRGKLKPRRRGMLLQRKIILPRVLLPYQPAKTINVNHLLPVLRALKDPEDEPEDEDGDEDEGDGDDPSDGEEEGLGIGGTGGGGAGWSRTVAAAGVVGKPALPAPKRVWPREPRADDSEPEEVEEEEEDDDDGPTPEEQRARYLADLGALLLQVYTHTLKYLHLDEALATLQVAITYPPNVEGPAMRTMVARLQLQNGAFEHAYAVLDSVIRDFPSDAAVVTALLTCAGLSRRMGYLERAGQQFRCAEWS
jgi:hypothetical protein